MSSAVATSRLKPAPTHHARYALKLLAAALQRAMDGMHDMGVVLDFGCGDQPYRPLFEGRCTTYLAADLPCCSRADVHITATGALPLCDASVDTVFSTQVLEHVSDPLAYLIEAKRVLRPGGNLLLSTHGVWTYHPHPEDYWRWTAAGLRRLLEQTGFEVLHMDGLLGPASAGLQLWQDAMLTRLPLWLHPAFVLAVQPVVVLSDLASTAASRSRDAAIYVVHARCPMEHA